jgi:hydrogenase maturation protease
MTSPDRQRGVTIVLGLGNPVRGDDAVGLRVADAVRTLLEAPPVPGVAVLTSTRAGLELIDLLSGAEAAIIVDAVESPDAVPGRIRRLSLDEVAGSARLVGAHDVTVAGAFALAREAGVPMPGTVEIYAVEITDTTRLAESLSPEVEAAVPTLARRIRDRL